MLRYWVQSAREEVGNIIWFTLKSPFHSDPQRAIEYFQIFFKNLDLRRMSRSITYFFEWKATKCLLFSKMKKRSKSIKSSLFFLLPSLTPCLILHMEALQGTFSERFVPIVGLQYFPS